MFKNFKETVIFNADEMINGDDVAFLIRRNPQVNNMALEKCGQQSLQNFDLKSVVFEFFEI